LPGFILSELPDYVPIQEDALSNFYQHTEIEKLILVPEACKYNHLALATCYQWTTTEFHPIMETLAPRSPGAWASIYAQLSIMPEQRLVLPRDVVRDSDSVRERSLYERLVNGPLYTAGVVPSLPLQGASIRAPSVPTLSDAPSPLPVIPRDANPVWSKKVKTKNRDPQQGMLIEIDVERMLWL
jgi:hypothetical protein